MHNPEMGIVAICDSYPLKQFIAALAALCPGLFQPIARISTPQNQQVRKLYWGYIFVRRAEKAISSIESILINIQVELYIIYKKRSKDQQERVSIGNGQSYRQISQKHTHTTKCIARQGLQAGCVGCGAVGGGLIFANHQAKRGGAGSHCLVPLLGVWVMPQIFGRT